MKDWKDTIKEAIEEHKNLSSEFASAMKECLLELQNHASSININVKRSEGLPYGCEVTIEKKTETLTLTEAVQLIRNDNSDVTDMKQAIEHLLAQKFSSWIL